MRSGRQVKCAVPILLCLSSFALPDMAIAACVAHVCVGKSHKISQKNSALSFGQLAGGAFGAWKVLARSWLGLTSKGRVKATSGK